jgi:hypothetical protein
MGISSIQFQEMLARTERNRGRSQAPADAVEDESELQNDIERECLRRGWLPLRSRMDRKNTRRKGECDFIILADCARVFLVETKSKTGKLSVEQQGFIAHARKLGKPVFVVRSMAEFYNVVDNVKVEE